MAEGGRYLAVSESLAIPALTVASTETASNGTDMKHDQVLRAPGYTLVGSPPPRLKYAATMARWSSWDTVGLCRDTSPGKHTANDMERTASQDDVILPQKSLTISTSSLCKIRHSASTPNGLSGISHQTFPPLSPNLLKTSLPFRRKSKQQSENPLHYPKNTETLLKHMEGIDVDLNAPNVDGDAPVHGIIRRKRRKRADLLMTLLVNGCSRVDVNQCSLSSGDTALHLAVMEEDEELVKMLLIFGAEVNPLNNHCQTPLDLAISRESCNTVAMLISVDGKTGDALLSEEDGPATIWKLEPFNQPFDTDNDLVNGVHDSHNEHDPPQVEGNGSEDCDAAGWEVVDDGSAMGDAPERGPCAGSEELVFSGGGWREVILKDLEEGKASSTLYQKLSEYINAHLTFSESLGTSVDEAIAMTKQQRELLRYQKTQHFPSSLTRPRAGSRVLCLDGGGVRGLIQIEVLRQLELRTGAKVTEIFDWIVGTSTGGILALGLVYAKKNLSELRQLYFKLRDHVFSAGRMGMGYNTESFERVLKQEFGTEALMSDVSYPRVLITAVYKKTNQPELHLLNNCFDNEFSKYPVWKVARYTSAAPLFFSELDHYVDGAVLANNPCDYALTAINNYFKGNRGQVAYNANSSREAQRDRVALVVSVGAGIFPAEDLGSTDAQQFLFFGKHWFKSKSGPFQTVENLITLLIKALMESESVAENCQSRLQSQGIPFFRFNPRLDEALPSPELTREQLLNMIMQTRYQTMGVHMDQLVDTLHQIRSIMNSA